MRDVVLCPGCGTRNSLSRDFCSECRTSLERGRRVSDSEARRTIGALDRRALQLRFRNYAYLATLIVVVVTWGGYTAYSYFKDPDSPSTQISAEPAMGDWPMYQRDPAHSGFTPDVSFEPEGEIHWVYETDGLIFTSPVVVEGAAYLSTSGRGQEKIVALDADTGGLLWEHPTASPIDASLSVAGGLVFATIRDGRVLALNTSDGSIHWEFDAGVILFASPTVYRGTVYVGTWDKELHALDAVTGRLLWSRKVGGKVTSNPVVNNQIIAFVAANNRVYILDVRTGRLRLEYRSRESTGSVALNGQRVYVADAKGGLRAIDWTEIHYPLEKKIRAFRVNLYSWGLIDSFPILKGSVWNRNRPTERFLGTPSVADGMVHVASSSGKVFKMDESNGEPVWAFDAGAKLSESVSVTADHVFVADAKGGVHVIDVNTGESEKQFELAGPITSAPVVANDTLYVATLNGKLYAIK